MQDSDCYHNGKTSMFQGVTFPSEQQTELTCSMAAKSLLEGEKARISNCDVVIQYGCTISVSACDHTELDKMKNYFVRHTKVSCQKALPKNP